MADTPEEQRIDQLEAEVAALNDLCRGLNLALKLANRTNEDLSEEVMRHQAGETYDQGWDHGFLAGRKHAREQAREVREP